jgi:hypothetical protein
VAYIQEKKKISWTVDAKIGGKDLVFDRSRNKMFAEHGDEHGSGIEQGHM